MAGKGDKPRPVKKKIFDSNYDQVNWSHTSNQEIRNYTVKKGKKIYRYP